MCVAPADQRKVSVPSNRLDSPPVLRMFSVDLHGVEVGVTLPKRAVAERMGDDRGTVTFVCEIDRLPWREFARSGSGRRIGPDDEQVSFRRRYLDAGDAGVADDSLFAIEVVVGDGDTVKPPKRRDSSGTPYTVWVVPRCDLWSPMKKTAMSVKVAVEHTRFQRATNINHIVGWNWCTRIVFSDRCESRVMSATRVVVRNPNSGDGKRTKRAKAIATDRGWEVLDSQGGDHTVELAAQAAGRADTVVACGGDGTLNKTVKGVSDAGELDRVSLGVLPAGTGNDFADNIGIRSIDHAFEVIESGETRQLDLALANGRPFLNSCVGGLTAESSAKTSPGLKRRLGVLAYVLTTLSVARDFEGLTLRVSVGPDRNPAWSGDALMLLIGNGRRFPGEQMRQANMEDGMVNVVIITDAPALDYLGKGAADKLLRRRASHLTRIKSSHLHVTHDGDPVQFSLDGEMVETNDLTVDSRPGAMLVFCRRGLRTRTRGVEQAHY